MVTERRMPYGKTEYHLIIKKLDKLCGSLSNRMILEELSKEVLTFSNQESIKLWNDDSSERFIEYISEKWNHSYCAVLVTESLLKEFRTSYPQTTFTHVSKSLSELAILGF